MGEACLALTIAAACTAQRLNRIAGTPFACDMKACDAAQTVLKGRTSCVIFASASLPQWLQSLEERGNRVSGRLIASLRLPGATGLVLKEATMSAKNTAVFGLYPDETELLEAIEQLKGAGFRTADLSILLPENLGSKDIGHEKHTKAPEGALAGGIAGAVIGGALGWL